MTETTSTCSLPAEVPSDTQLVRDVLAGDRQALEAFVSRSRCIPRMVAALNRRTGAPFDPHELDDLSQEVLVTVWEKLKTFEGKASLEAWVYRIALLKFLNRRRRKHSHSRTALGLEADEVQGETPLARVEFEGLHHCLEELPLREADLLRAKHFEGRTFEEIADRTGTSSNTLKTRYYRARQRLETCLRGKGHSEEDLS